ncbi:MAG: class I SAM-dependent methyltransferase [Bacteroidales bacterium]|jgi:predicted RNA methylase
MELTSTDDPSGKLFDMIRQIDLQDLNISGHSLQYLIRYRENSSFYKKAYAQLLEKAIKKLNKPVSESTFIDYGGGCGMLSFLARATGFRTVVYNDIFGVALDDARKIAEKLNLHIDHFICGDAGELVSEIDRLKLDTDLICSFDVLEHIHDPENWITTISKLRRFFLLFMTSANPKNPFIARRLKKIHKTAEYLGCENNIRVGDIFKDNSFLNERENIIRNKYPDLSQEESFMLASRSRGLMQNEIEDVAGEYIDTGKISYKIDHPTNTCEPYTGNWAERLIDINKLEKSIKDPGLKVRITNSFYCYSERRILNIIKFLLNKLISVSGPGSLFLSPSITLEIEKTIN